MELSNTERVTKALVLLRNGLRPMCELTWQGYYGDGWLKRVNSKLHDPASNGSSDDVAFLLKGIKVTWNDVFSHGFDRSVLSLVFELSKARNRSAHQQLFSDDDTLRALDSMERLLDAFNMDEQHNKIRNLKRELLRKFKREPNNILSAASSKPGPICLIPLEETAEVCGVTSDRIRQWIEEPTFLVPQSEVEDLPYLRFDFLNLIEIRVTQQLLGFGFLVEQLLGMASTDTLGWMIDNFLFLDSDRCFRGDGVRESSHKITVTELEEKNDTDIHLQGIPPPSKPLPINPEIDPQNVHNYIDLKLDDWYIVINLHKIRKDLLATLTERRLPIPNIDVGDSS